MSAPERFPKWLVAAAAIAAIPYCVAFHIGTMKSRAVEEFGKQGLAMLGIARQANAYACSHEGEWPPIDAVHKRFTVAPGLLPPSFHMGKAVEYPLESDTKAVLVGPIGRHSAVTLEPGVDPADYIYLPYAVASEEEAMTLVEAVRHGADPSKDISVETGKGTLGSNTFYRFRRDLHKKMAADHVIPHASSAVFANFPMFIQRPRDGHAWVIFADNHVAYLPYPGPFPLTKSFIAAVQ
ncbi:MAG: hypothetical protein K1Y02_04035 [Candidatus Hydrogenedentes bacterium]|nr:hypothetical protein [Candidatus Hydrogenedentota bacterium]